MFHMRAKKMYESSIDTELQGKKTTERYFFYYLIKIIVQYLIFTKKTVTNSHNHKTNPKNQMKAL